MEIMDRCRHWNKVNSPHSKYYGVSGIMMVGFAYQGNYLSGDYVCTGPILGTKIICSDNLFQACARMVRGRGVLWVEPLFIIQCAEDELEFLHRNIIRTMKRYRFRTCRFYSTKGITMIDTNVYGFEVSMIWGLCGFLSDHGHETIFLIEKKDHLGQILENDETYRVKYFSELCNEKITILEDPKTQSFDVLTASKICGHLVGNWSESDSDETVVPRNSYHALH